MIFKGQTYVVRKDLCELVDFMQEIDKLYNGFVDNFICQLLAEGSTVKLREEFDKSIKQRLSESFENLVRIPFISSGSLFKKFFEIETATPMNVSANTSFD